ncbi:MAG: protein-export chaperone SecB [Oscillibacter sp.]|nr:protein-export chaperone SecB [Oscillibacter sp.]
MDGIKSVLALNHLVFDHLSFRRKGFKNENELKFSFGFRFDSQSETQFVNHVRVVGTKEGEYEFTVEASGYFTMQGTPVDLTTEQKPVGIDILSKQNATAIIFPYIRSQISLLTAQPELEPVILPPLNIGAMVTQAEQEHNQ